MAGVHLRHLDLINEKTPEMSAVNTNMFTAITRSLNPHLPALAAFVAMAEAVKNADFGVLADYKLVRLPLSLIGADKVRYRTHMLEFLHDSILSLRMSDITVDELRKALRPHGLCVMFLCSCGVVMGHCDDVRRFYGSNDHQRMDRLRSAIDAEGNPVIVVDDIDQIPVRTMDLHDNGAEIRLLKRIEGIARHASQAGHPKYNWIDQELARFVERSRETAIAA